MDVDYSKVILKALAEIRRGQILTTKANLQTEDLYDNALVYAVLHRVYPIHHEDPRLKDDRVDILDSFPFYETYGVGRNQAKAIAELLDGKWRSGQSITFYELEQPYRYGHREWEGEDPRSDLINICRYFYLLGWFDDRFWDQFISDSPSEANDVTTSWDRSEIVDWI